jgi:hypothetical protein
LPFFWEPGFECLKRSDPPDNHQGPLVRLRSQARTRAKKSVQQAMQGRLTASWTSIFLDYFDLKARLRLFGHQGVFLPGAPGRAVILGPFRALRWDSSSLAFAASADELFVRF